MRRKLDTRTLKLWRKIENALLIILIPAIVLVLTNWGFEDENQLNRILLIINVLAVAIIKSVGLIFSDDETPVIK